MDAFFTALATSGFSGIVSSLFSKLTDRFTHPDAEKTRQLKTDLNPYLESTFKKCSTIKTLLNPQRPTNLLDICATQRFIINDHDIDQYGMVGYIRSDCSNLILSGTGGSGKSIFARYLWIALCIHGEGRIPLFLELRNLNNLTAGSLSAFIYHTVTGGMATMGEADFKWYLSRGDFILILDGFDEVAIDKKQAVQQQIIELAEIYPNLKIILTSRPESNFASWPSFEVAQMAAMQESDVIELVEKAEFDAELKAKFIKRIESSKLFERHQSFLENPLLVSMLLLTFSYNLDIPDRMHLFYQQAFDALFQRHDSYKPGGYKREFNTRITEDVFKRVVSYFCLITYQQEEYSFTEDSALSAISKSLSIASVGEQPDKFLKDLVSCVCFLVQEGIYYAFSHRSFQEYFCACGLACVTPTAIPDLISGFLRRHADQVVVMFADMHPELFRRGYVIPTADRFGSELQLAKKADPIGFLSQTGWRFRLRRLATPRREVLDSSVGVYLDGAVDFGNFVDLPSKIKKSPVRRRTKSEIDALRTQDRAFYSALFSKIDCNKTTLVTVAAKDGVMECSWVEALKDGQAGAFRFDDALVEAFSGTSLCRYILERARDITEYVATCRREERKATSTITDVFGIKIQ